MKQYIIEFFAFVGLCSTFRFFFEFITYEHKLFKARKALKKLSDELDVIEEEYRKERLNVLMGRGEKP